MDNLAHALVGAALGRAVAGPHVPRPALLGAVAANAPDWAEVFIGLPGDRATYLVLHRGITHSLLGAALETLVLAAIVGGVLRWRTGRGPAWGWLLLCVGITVASHLYMDWQGSYGLRPFLPWNGTWYYADWVAIVDPFFWLVPLIGLAWGAPRHWIPLAAACAVGAFMTGLVIVTRDVVALWVLGAYGALCLVAAIGWVRYWFGPALSRGAAFLSIAVLAVYAGAQGAASLPVKAATRRDARARFGTQSTWAALTRVGHPFTWERVLASADTVVGERWRLPRHLENALVVRAVRETRDGRAMGQFARFLTAEVDSSRGSQTVYLRDARYARAGSSGWGVVEVRVE